MNEEERSTIVFQIRGRADRLPEKLEKLMEIAAHAAIEDLSESDLERLKSKSNIICSEISDALSSIAPEIKFITRISFQKGSIEWNGIVSATKSKKTKTGLESIGNPALLPKIISATASSIIGSHLPANRYSRAETSCIPITPSTRSNVQQQFEVLKHSIDSLKKSLDSLAIATIEYFTTTLNYALRKASQLPFYITGANPYAFSTSGGIIQSTYSKVTVRLFGWCSLFVVLYVTIASQKIVSEFGIFDKSNIASILFSLVSGVIVFFCDRFILSYPKVVYRVDVAVNQLRASKSSGFDRIFLQLQGFLIQILSLYWIKSIALTIFRLALALVISGLLISTIIISTNEKTIQNEIESMNGKNAIQKLREIPDYSYYEELVQKERRAYFKSYANLECRQIALRGVRQSEDGLIKANKSSMSGAYPGSYDVDISENPPDFDCGVRRPEPCIRASSACPEFGRITIDQKILDRELSQVAKERKEVEKRLEIEYKQLKINAPDLSKKLEALGRVYQRKVEALKNGDNTLLFEIANIAPFLLILLAFELLPAVAKLFFPASSYDTLIAKEDFFHRLHATVPRTIEIQELLQYHFSSTQDTATIEKLRELDLLEKEKEDELDQSLENVFEKLNEFCEVLVSMLGFAVTALITIALLSFFAALIINVTVSAASIVDPLFDPIAFVEKLLNGLNPREWSK
jgi:hypothetical protein